LVELSQPDEQDSPAPEIRSQILAARETWARLEAAGQGLTETTPPASLDPERIAHVERQARDLAAQSRRHCDWMLQELTRRRAGAGDGEVPALIEHLLHDESADVRGMCAWMLEIYPREPVTGALRQALADSDPDVVHHASVVLADREDRDSIPLFLSLLDHEGWRHRLSAARALVKLKVADPRLVREMEELARDPEAEEHDLDVLEYNDLSQRLAEPGEPEPRQWLTVAELIEQARQLLERGEESREQDPKHDPLESE
jgi:HEAT repeat protein